MSDTATDVNTCEHCGTVGGMHRIDCPTLAALRAQLGEPPGANATVDGEAAHIDASPPDLGLENVSTDETVLANLARCVEKEAEARTVANAAKNALAAAHKATVAAYEHAAEHYAHSRQLEMTLTTGGTEPEDEGE